MSISSSHHPPTTGQRVRELEEQFSAIEQDLITLFGTDSSHATEVARLKARYAKEWNELIGNRGLELPVVVFLGETGAGKSTLIHLLTGDSEPKGTTTRLVWHGPVSPQDLNPACEEFQRIDSSNLPCVLLDTPGFGTSAFRSRAIEEQVRTAGRLKVVVVPSSSLAAENWRQTVARMDGSIILPVIHLDPGQSRELAVNRSAIQAEVDRNLSSLSKAMPGSTLLSPLLLPDLQTQGDPAALRSEVLETLREGVADLVARYGTDAADRIVELENSWQRCRRELTPIVEQLVTPRVREKQALLEETLRDLPREIVREMLDDTSRLQALFRVELRAAFMEKIPIWAFPYRSLAGLLCLTTGVWDRLVLGLSGSLPSMASTLFNSAKSFQLERSADQSHGKGVPPQMERKVRERLDGPLQDFHRALARNLDTEQESPAPTRANFHIHGVRALAAAWQESLRKATDAARRKGSGLILPVAIFGTALFWLLFLGPLVHVYGQYVPAAFQSLTGHWDATHLTNYPAMGGGFWATALVLSIIPVFLVALFQTARRLSTKKIRGCLERHRTSMLREVEGGGLPLEVELDDPRSRSCQRLFSLLSKPE